MFCTNWFDTNSWFKPSITIVFEVCIYAQIWIKNHGDSKTFVIDALTPTCSFDQSKKTCITGTYQETFWNQLGPITRPSTVKQINMMPTP